MTKEHYDEAYQIESGKFPAIVRMTNVNLIIWLILLVIYIGACLLAPFVFEHEEPIETYIIVISIIANLLILGFAYKCIRGDASDFLQGLMLVAIPVWAIASIFVPAFKDMTSWLFIFPLLWLEIMILVEKVIHKRAQRTAMDLAEYEKERDEKLRRNII